MPLLLFFTFTYKVLQALYTYITLVKVIVYRFFLLTIS